MSTIAPPLRAPIRGVPLSPATAPTARNQAFLVLAPPYERPGYTTNLEAPEGLAPGTVIGLRLAGSVPAWSTLESAVRQLRSRYASAPVVLLVELSPEDSLLVSAVASRMHVRAVIPAGAPLRESLRRALTQCTGLAAAVVEWLETAGVRMSPETSQLIHEIFTLAPEYPDLRRLLQASGIPESTARFRFHKRLLPPPSRWFQAARALHAALLLQQRPDAALLALACELGYSDHSALSQLVHRSFRLRPSAIRGLLGWEWMLDRWLSRYPRCRRQRWV
jgi:AraC-like DNA-binding protein